MVSLKEEIMARHKKGSVDVRKALYEVHANHSAYQTIVLGELDSDNNPVHPDNILVDHLIEEWIWFDDTLIKTNDITKVTRVSEVSHRVDSHDTMGIVVPAKKRRK